MPDPTNQPAAAEASGAPTHAVRPRRWFLRWRVLALVAVVALGAALSGKAYRLATDLLYFETTSDARVEARTTVVAASHAGQVSAVGFDDFEEVERGAVLVELDASRTIVAPVAGIVGRRTLDPGAALRLDQPVVTIISPTERWVVANFKETQLADIAIGADAEVEVDAIPDRTFRGKVLHIAPGTKAYFALIPPENATGNFTKVVQRVPTKIALTAESIAGYERRLIPGLSATVRIRHP